MNSSNLLLLFFNEPKKWAAIAILIVSAGLLIGQLISIFHSGTDVKVSPQRVSSQNNQAMITAHSALFKRPLFGEYVPNLSDMEIKQSTLDVEVVGIMYSHKEDGSQVLIRTGEGEEHVYGIGDELPGGAVIKQISKNGVVVFYNGSLESLSLPQNELLFDEPAKPLIEE